MADDAEHAETRQSTAEEIAAFARLLNHPHLERQTAAADEVVNLIGREPCPDDALLGGICHHPDAMEGLTRILLNADDEAKQVACNLLFMLSMSEPDRPFDVSCSAHIANRAIIGETAGLFDAVVAGERLQLPMCLCFFVAHSPLRGAVCVRRCTPTARRSAAAFEHVWFHVCSRASAPARVPRRNSQSKLYNAVQPSTKGRARFETAL